uniref:Uncharacterized protein LOC113788460 n=1 Tax=Dermatophagoides pteronyssinus TaxID=6956 RepID=A0A6P6XPA3_DERPT|nr:uncharacterized protein LOC113788460 [Dermatophagoides pteronyssinus]
MNQQKQNSRIHNPILRIFVLLHGTSGLQLSPIRFCWPSMFRLFINIILNIFIFYLIFGDQSIWFEIHLITIKMKKLYEQYLLANYYAIFPLIYFGFIGAYHLYGNRIIRMLDSPVFDNNNNIDDCRRNRLKIIAMFIVIKLFWDIRYLFGDFYRIFHSNWSQIRLIMASYLFDSSFFINWIILYYHQILLFFTLKKIQQKLPRKISKINKTTITNSISLEQRLFRSILILSNANRHLQYYYSSILLLVLIDQINQIIGFLSYWLLHQTNLQFINLKCYSKYNHLNIYRQYYQLSIFTWLNIDLLLLMNLLFFSFGYVLIISQTTTID